jgi:DNA-directed RNA polymerase subunit RPC12/RpoP
LIRFVCPACRKVLKAPVDIAGGKVACPRCGHRLEVPFPPQSLPPHGDNSEIPLWQQAPPPVRLLPELDAPADREEGVGGPSHRPTDPDDSDPQESADLDDLEEVKRPSAMTPFTHTRCYHCGVVIRIADAYRKTVLTGSYSVSGGDHSHGYVSGGGSQWQRVDYCQDCFDRAAVRWNVDDRMAQQVILYGFALLVAMLVLLSLLFGCFWIITK